MRPSLTAFAATVQAFFILGHLFFLWTWLRFVHPSHAGIWAGAVAILAFSFLGASMLARRFHQAWARVAYTLAALWLGFATYFFLAAWVCWVVWLCDMRVNGREVAFTAYGAAAVMAAWGAASAAVPRVRRVGIALPNLPQAWRGGVVALVSDLHLGHVRGARLSERLARALNREHPKLVLLAGDIFDGTPCDAVRLIAPLARLEAPAYYVAGNHEGFGDREPFLAAAEAAGLRRLHARRIDLEGLQLVGAHFTEAADSRGLGSLLHALALDRARPSILLTHAPHHLEVVERAGVSLMLAGHTHGGQFFPVTLIVRRIYGRFAHGLQRLGALQVFTSYGVGTWGPPLRVGTTPEIALLELRNE